MTIGESLFTVFRHFQGKGQTLTSARYGDMLINKLKPVMRSERQELLSYGVLLLHDNAPSHMAAHIMGRIHYLLITSTI